MAIALRPLLMAPSIISRCGSQALADGLLPGRTSRPRAVTSESVDTTLAGFAPGSKSVDTTLAGFGSRRFLGDRTATPAFFR